MTPSRPTTRRRRRHGYTLMELMVVVAIMATIAVFASPLLTNTSDLRCMAASAVLTSDIELAQVMTISDPSQPIVVKFDLANDTYWLAEAAAPDVPIAREDNGAPYSVTMGVGRAAAAEGVTLSHSGITNDTLEFNEIGGVVNFTSTPTITMTLGGQWYKLELSPNTGTITETSN